jgi:hypothetical protein
MKKLFTIVVAAALMFAAAGQVQATALETSGEFRARFWNLGDYLTGGENQEFWDQRLRLSMVWPVAEGVKVSARADIMEGFWGDKLVSGSQSAPGADVTYSASSNSRPAIAFDHVNLMFVVPNTPMTVTVGRQDASWGPGNFTKSDNRDRFKVTGKFGDVTALYTYDKYTEVLSLHGVSSLGDRRQHSVGAIGTFAGWNAGVIYGLILDESNPATDTTLNAVDAYAMGKAGPVDLKFELTYGFGENDNAGSTPNVDLSGMLAYVGVSMPAGPVTLGIEGSYASGDDKGTADENEGVLRAEYQSPFWSVILFNNFDLNGYANESMAGADDVGVGNAMAGKVSCAATVMPGLSLYGAVVYAQRLEETAVGAGNDEALGLEFDLVAAYALSENVTVTVGGGYLSAGDYFGSDPDNPWGAVVAFTTKF